MKKLMKKIKSNKLIPKLVATLTICMVLLSSLSVSVFAADDEVSAANEETESITDVWTSVMNWITSSLGSAQGAFIGSSHLFTLDFGEPVSTPIGLELYPISNFPDVNDGDLIPFSFNDEGIITTGSFIISDSNPAPEVSDISASKYALISDGIETSVFAFFDPVLDGQFYDGWYCYFMIPVSILGSPSLTFLGTLAVVGVAIALIMLLVYVISRFLRLRG